MASKPRVRVPKTAKKGDIVTIKTLISHRMESGRRKDKNTGELIPQKIIDQFVCTFNGKRVITSKWHGSISENPYMAFTIRAEESGEFEFTWRDQDGSIYSKKAKMAVN